MSKSENLNNSRKLFKELITEAKLQRDKINIRAEEIMKLALILSNDDTVAEAIYKLGEEIKKLSDKDRILR